MTVLRFGVELDHFQEALLSLSFDGVKHLSDLVFVVDTLADFDDALTLALERYPSAL